MSSSFLHRLFIPGFIVVMRPLQKIKRQRKPVSKLQKVQSNQIVQLANTKNYALLVIYCLHSKCKGRAIIFSVIVETSKRRWNVKEVVKQLQLTLLVQRVVVELQLRKGQKGSENTRKSSCAEDCRIVFLITLINKYFWQKMRKKQNLAYLWNFQTVCENLGVFCGVSEHSNKQPTKKGNSGTLPFFVCSYFIKILLLKSI